MHGVSEGLFIDNPAALTGAVKIICGSPQQWEGQVGTHMFADGQ